LVIVIERYSPTIPKVIQRIAATMGCGMAARIPPNFPKIEKKIMKTAEIWITLRLPTRVSPISPTFSLQKSANIKNQTQDKSNIHSCQAKEQILFFLP
jgi:hypothetical protein